MGSGKARLAAVGKPRPETLWIEQEQEECLPGRSNCAQMTVQGAKFWDRATLWPRRRLLQLRATPNLRPENARKFPAKDRGSSKFRHYFVDIGDRLDNDSGLLLLACCIPEHELHTLCESGEQAGVEQLKNLHPACL